jgi:YD repeat-containing protein
LLSLSIGADNRLATFGYDAAGNMTSDSTGDTYTYDAESRMKTVSPSRGGTYGYTYDGDGKRVEKSTVSGQTWTPTKLYWYDGSANVLDETDATGSTTNRGCSEYVYLHGERLARQACSREVPAPTPCLFNFPVDAGISAG